MNVNKSICMLLLPLRSFFRAPLFPPPSNLDELRGGVQTKTNLSRDNSWMIPDPVPLLQDKQAYSWDQCLCTFSNENNSCADMIFDTG